MGALPGRQFVQTLRHPWTSFVIRSEPGIGHNLDDEKESKMNNLKSMVSASALIVAMTAGAATTAHAAKWAYGGEHGPEYWAELSGEYAACAGAEQSPINLVATHSATTEAIETNWRSFVSEVVNNGHTIQANAPAGNDTLFGGERYELLQLHFHAESEHTADGESFPMEAHFVHRSASGALMVLGVFLVPGAEHPWRRPDICLLGPVLSTSCPWPRFDGDCLVRAVRFRYYPNACSVGVG